MFGSSMLDIAVGVVFVFLLLSIFATAVNEIILSRLNMRGRELLDGLKSLLNEDTPNNPLALVNNIYNHGQICGLYKGAFEVSGSKITKQTQDNLPAYIPSRNFALALLETIKDHPDTLQSAADAAVKAGGDARNPAILAWHNATAEIDKLREKVKQELAAKTQQQANAVAAALAANPQQPAPNPPPPAATVVSDAIVISQALREGAAALAANKATEKVGKPLVSMIHLAGNDAHKLQKAVEDWYNSAMDRVSGWYKYRTQKVLLTIGLVMAIALNADTIGIVRQLSKDPTLRQSIVAAAQTAKAPTSGGAQDFKSQMDSARSSFDNVTDLGIPLGWPHGAPRLHNLRMNPFAAAPWEALLWSKSTWEALLGWLLTAVAISLGAPFWFDALNKIMVIRSTVKPTEKSKDEASKS
jgi:hypothetical protein